MRDGNHRSRNFRNGCSRNQVVENVIARIMTKVRAKCAITGIGMQSLSSGEENRA